ncbi:glycosyltransferase family 4 protein [Qipengyuania nanhaisediminis]|uniref:glycosyltransferase family 4 protein n=1 Tax=Qipengyuania nanhaisediminis TaxID=604088 RepID=UPI0038B28822
MLDRLGAHIASRVSAADRKPDLLVAHKLTVEGIAVAEASKLTGLPFALTIQGNTDRKILRARPDLHPRFREIYRHAKTVFAFAPCARDAVIEMLGERDDPIRLLPCPTDLDTPIAPRVTRGELVSVFHLKNRKVKNLGRLAEATRMLGKEGFTRPLAIIGGGETNDFEACRTITGESDLIDLAGPLDRAALRDRLNAASAFVMPSVAESFGLVFVEALFAGLPIIYPASTAIDGYFDGLPFAIAVDAGSPRAIADAMRYAVENESEMKGSLAEWQHSPASERFRRPAIAAAFADGLSVALRY